MAPALPTVPPERRRLRDLRRTPGTAVDAVSLSACRSVARWSAASGVGGEKGPYISGAFGEKRLQVKDFHDPVPTQKRLGPARGRSRNRGTWFGPVEMAGR